jgi:MarR family transcriptional regulator, 2-MHQ and catechol-resistance regulon repressor
MRVAIHPERRLVGLNDLHHVQGIERRRERAALIFGVGIDDRCIMADNHARTTRFLPNQFSNFDAKFLCSATESAGVKGVSSGVKVDDFLEKTITWGEALSAIARQLDVDLQRSGVSTTDFRVMEALLHKGPLPVNVIGPKVNLTPGAISVAVDRLEGRGLVARAEGKRDRRVRVVALTKEGEKVISPAYHRHAVLLEHIFEPLSENQRLSLENMLKLLGRHAETMGEIPEE